MMKFFKYLIFILLSTFSLNVFAVISPNSDFVPSYADCAAYINSKKSSFGQIQSTGTQTLSETKVRCSYKWSSSSSGAMNNNDYYDLFIKNNQCEAGQKKFLDGYITPPGGFAPSSVCYQGCIYNSDGGGTAFDTPNGNENWGINAESTGATCPTDTPKGEDKPNPNPPMTPDECKNANGSDAYCNKPNDKKCPSGYKQGTFNNQQICIKPSPDPDPTKPNPNDPNNGGGDGEGNCNGTNNCNTTNFDDSEIISAINASKNAITSAISSLSSTLSSALNSVTSAINSNTSAVNANGDKVTNAVNAGTQATKENGKKLDGIKDGIDEGNGLLGGIKDTLNDIKNWLTTEHELPPSQQPDIQEHNVEGYEKSYVSWSSSCPPDVQVPISLMGQSSTLVLKWSPWCELLSKLRWAIIACAYFSAAYIILGMR